jgi:hypothetical protein
LLILPVTSIATTTQSFLTHHGPTNLLSLKAILDNFSQPNLEPDLVSNDSPYYEISEFIDLPTNTANFSAASINCQSLNAKHSQLEALTHLLARNNKAFDAICLQETWLGTDADASLLQLNGYQLICQAATASTHGGVGIYLHSSYKFSTRTESTKNPLWEALFIEVTHQSLPQPIIIGSVYRPPNALTEAKQQFIHEFSQTPHHLQNTKYPTIVTGDFNLDLLTVNNNTTVSLFLNSIISTGHTPLITYPTRLTDHSCTLIDNIFCNKTNAIEMKSGILTTQISDHQLYFTQLSLKTPTNTKKKITLTLRHPNMNELIKADLQNMNIITQMNPNQTDDPTINYDVIEAVLTSLIDKYTTTRTVTFDKHKHKKNPWITYGIIKSIKYKDKLHLKMKRSPPGSQQQITLKTNLATYDKILKQTIRQAKAMHHIQTFTQYKNNPKQTWKSINSILHRGMKKDAPIETLKDSDENNITSPIEISNTLNKFFTEIGSKIADTIPQTNETYTTYLPNITPPPFDFHQVQPDDIDKIIRSLQPKHSSGQDNISTILIKSLREELTEPICLIINQMFYTSIFPNKLKIAKIKPIHKKGDTHSCENYRPISLLPAISKILEKVILLQLDTHFHENNLYYSSQYGFRKKRSTEHAILELTDRIINSMDHNISPTAIFLDLTKAFDCLNHNILIQKLKHYGLQNNALQLLINYLSNRQQSVMLDSKTKSTPLEITTGVPQGSILGPFLFLIYVNDLSHSSNALSFINYADDTTLISTINHTTRTTNNLNNELNKVFKWLCSNKLSLNITKTKCITFHTPHHKPTFPQLHINNIPIAHTDHFNFLGITIDKHLNWKPHINKITTKISQICGTLNKLKHTVPKQTLLTIYQALIVPHLTYGVLAWAKNSNTTPIFKLQKRSVRIITQSQYNAHTDPLFKQLNILKLQDIYHTTALKFFFQYSHNELPEYFTNYIIQNRQFSQSQTQTRYTNRLAVPVHRHQFYKSGLRYSIVSIVNECPTNILQKIATHSKLAFCRHVKTHLIANYHDH